MKNRTRVAGIIIKDKKILFLKGIGCDDLWTPGGGIEEGERNEECLKRELKEEIGATLVSAKLFKEYNSSSFYNDKLNLKQIIFIAEIEGEIKPSMEIEDYIWVSKDDYLNKKYNIAVTHENSLIDDLIKEGIW